ncbi:FecR domain-containing protein [Maribellus sp. YY47]|uniref:FecR family protein n=1 Tax=Maribellus sp. YY47 TaxID=2929486 RepID=UPI00200111E0|nr:FecR domain-containing protein [Maribellus sp. YY47]MCK3684791.1 FecR domain-containing protein [Maribellus sp. YY47]
METKLPGNFQELITNSYFIEWVKNPTPESDQFWQHFLMRNPLINNEFEKARLVISKFQRQKKVIDEDSVREIWNNIEADLDKKPLRKKLINSWTIAATIILILGLAGIFYLETKTSEIDYEQLAAKVLSQDGVTLFLSDGQTKMFTSKQPSFDCLETGAIRVDSSLVMEELSGSTEGSTQRFNQLAVPYGKRSKLFLSDGTKVILNSGSHIIFPVVFSGEKREVYLKGEAYFMVAHNQELPFYVKTDQMSVKVLGTEFNVSAYPEENNHAVVLVTGSVETQIKKDRLTMEKGEKLTLNKSGNYIEREFVDVREFISWKDEWLYCNNESIDRIAAKLSRYYNLTISFHDKKAKMLTMTGKLDLRSDYHRVLDVICFSAPVSYSDENEEIIIKLK